MIRIATGGYHSGDRTIGTRLVVRDKFIMPNPKENTYSTLSQFLFAKRTPYTLEVLNSDDKEYKDGMRYRLLFFNLSTKDGTPIESSAYIKSNPIIFIKMNIIWDMFWVSNAKSKELAIGGISAAVGFLGGIVYLPVWAFIKHTIVGH